ncbi:MAG: penicillin-resistant DD-carboxypeptidase [Parcubacteria group bacterium Gr01-1014_24]|nr:MAG: penicillin-resistant DD-carboxypeptidase [Parcubacteria group bacterium Gr01-1014_24]
MIKKLKIGLLIAVLSLCVGVVSVAQAADLTFSVDTTVTVNSRDYTITANSAATTIEVGATTLTVTVPASSTLTLVSPLRDTLTNNLGLAQSCNLSQNSVLVTGATTVIFTPTSTACTFGGSGGLVSGGGGGGGSSSASPTATVATSTTPVALTISPEVTMTTVSPGCSGGNKYNTSTGALCVSGVVSPVSAGPYNFGTTTLKSGSKGEPVKELQRFLNKVLNLGLVLDGKLGPKTIAVIKKWQKDNGLKADGLIGKKTKALMNAMAK